MGPLKYAMQNCWPFEVKKNAISEIFCHKRQRQLLLILGRQWHYPVRPLASGQKCSSGDV